MCQGNIQLSTSSVYLTLSCFDLDMTIFNLIVSCASLALCKRNIKSLDVAIKHNDDISFR